MLNLVSVVNSFERDIFQTNVAENSARVLRALSVTRKAFSGDKLHRRNETNEAQMPAELNVLAVLPNWKKLGVSCSFRKDNHWTHLPGAPNDINSNWLRDCPQNFILAFNALLVGQIFFKYFSDNL